jgi:cytochrome oxidase Cu insertion factor (SCO1/SenC/PrrC family)
MRGLTILIAAPFIAVACTSAAVDTGAANTTPTEDAPVSEAVVTDAPATAEERLRNIELTDAATGETFTLASLEGQPVAIEPMAIWCTNCKVQNDNIKARYEDLVATGTRFISLGVEPNEKRESLAEYADQRGYEWTFAQSPIEFSRALNDLFGPQILAVPATPLIIFDETGEIVFQDFGFHGPDQLLEIVEEAVA